MCGIWGKLGACTCNPVALVKCLEPRGPEYTAYVDISGTEAGLGFTRLAINGLTPAGHQPFFYKDTHVVCNGEIYNYKELAARWAIELAEGTSDCAIIPHLANRLDMTELCRTLDGVFAFLYVDVPNGYMYAARDPYGVRPLFYAQLANGTHVWASELKGLPTEHTISVQPFPPGTWRKYALDTGELLEECKYHSVPHVKLAALSAESDASAISIAKHVLRASLLRAVKKRLLSDRPIGALLSGGLDSSLVAAIAARELAREGKKLHTFSIGMPGSTDLEYAQKVATHIGSIHHNIVVSVEDFLNAIPEVVCAIESYDITSVRASVGNWLLGKYIRANTDIKVVFNGDGSDEIGGGYLYFYAAPSDEEFEAESERLLNEIHLYDVLRSDRSMAAHGLEARTPFLDKQVVASWRAIGTSLRRPVKVVGGGGSSSGSSSSGGSGSSSSSEGDRMEKYILRAAFELDDYLPPSVLWRKKEAFSDGVSSTQDSWYLRCVEYAKSAGLHMDTIRERTCGWHNAPKTEEAYWYRMLFEHAYGPKAASVIPHMWMPRWIAGASDPSARTLKDLY